MGRGRGSRDKLSITRTRGVSLARRHSGKKRARKRKTNDEIDAGAVWCTSVVKEWPTTTDDDRMKRILVSSCQTTVYHFGVFLSPVVRRNYPHPLPLLLAPYHLLLWIYLWNCITRNFPSMYRFHASASKFSREKLTKSLFPTIHCNSRSFFRSFYTY